MLISSGVRVWGSILNFFLRIYSALLFLTYLGQRCIPHEGQKTFAEYSLPEKVLLHLRHSYSDNGQQIPSCIAISKLLNMFWATLRTGIEVKKHGCKFLVNKKSSRRQIKKDIELILKNPNSLSYSLSFSLLYYAYTCMQLVLIAFKNIHA